MEKKTDKEPRRYIRRPKPLWIWHKRDFNLEFLPNLQHNDATKLVWFLPA